jgi:hypothetical protein
MSEDLLRRLAGLDANMQVPAQCLRGEYAELARRAAATTSDGTVTVGALLAVMRTANPAALGLEGDRGPTRVGLGWRETYMGGSAQAEQALFATLAPRITTIQDVVLAADEASRVHRAFHNKGDAVRVTFTVADDLPEQFRVGVFAPGARYDGVGRFSRSQSHSASDSALDERGFAWSLEHKGGAQHFLGSNTPRSFARDPITFVRAGEAIAKSSKLLLPLRLAKAVGLGAAIKILFQLATETPDRRIAFTGQTYWSRTPFQIGDAAVKWVLKPNESAGVEAGFDGPNYLSKQLEHDLTSTARSFTLYFQPFVDEHKTPIEDAAVEWKETDAPLIRVGVLTLPPQAPSATLMREVDGTAFSPWVTQDLRPLGAMNRARQLAYDTSAVHRGACPLGFG